MFIFIFLCFCVCERGGVSLFVFPARMYTGGHRPPSFAKVADEEVESEERVGGSVHVDCNDELPNVLVTNDDGIKAPGLQALVAGLVQGGKCNVFVCAPDS